MTERMRTEAERRLRSTLGIDGLATVKNFKPHSNAG